MGQIIYLPQVARPTIAEVFQEFLADQEKRVKVKTLQKYEGIIGLFESCINDFGYQTLTKEELNIFNRFYNARGRMQRDFTHIFGPEKIPENVGEFLSYFMIRKVMCSKELKRSAGTVIKKLAAWLEENEYITKEEYKEMVALGARAVRELPAADELEEALTYYTGETNLQKWSEQLEDCFEVVKVNRGWLHLQSLSEENETLVVPVPVDVSERCRPGWFISLLLGKSGNGWQIIEAGHVYPL